MTLPSWLNRLNERINNLSLRERGLLLIAICSVLFFLWHVTLMQPLWARKDNVQEQLEQVSQRQAQLNESLQTLFAKASGDAERRQRQRLKKLEADIGDLESELRQMHGAIAGNRGALDVLTELLGAYDNLEVVTLEGLPPEPMKPGGSETGQNSGVYIHRIRLVVESTFAGILDYLELVERLPSGVYWESMSLSVPDWPTNRVELIIYTLAPGESWLGV